MSNTYTIATMEIPATMHAAILRRLQEADYVHAIGDDGLLDLSGIGLQACPGTNAWWQRSSDWHPATTQACLEQMEDMREDWSQLAKLLGFATFTDPEEIFSAVRALKKDPPESPIGRLQLRQGQIQQLADFAGEPIAGTAEEDQDLLQLTLGHNGHSGPGLYAHFEDVPEGGAIFLGIPEGDPQLLFSAGLPHPANGEERRWFMVGANATARGLALVNYGDSESQYINDLDDDAAALLVARQFTSENEPRKRAELQVAIVNAMARARSAQQAAQPSIEVRARRVRYCLEAISLNLGSIESSARHLSAGSDDDRLRVANMHQETSHARQLVQAAGEAVMELLTGTSVPSAAEYFAPEYYTNDGAGLVTFTRVPPSTWPEWAAEAHAREVPGPTLHQHLLDLLGAKDHASGCGVIGMLQGRTASLQAQLNDSERRVVDAQRLAWALVDAAGGSVEIGPSVLATMDWRGKQLQQLKIHTGGIVFTSREAPAR